MGTVVEIRISGGGGSGDADLAVEVENAVINEMRRLERMFSVYDADSELSCWRRGELRSSGAHEQSPEFVELMSLALDWQVRSDGRFNPAVGVLERVWRSAADNGERPSTSELQRIADSISAPRYAIDDSIVVPVGDCSVVTFNAIAKGFIVDKALEKGWSALGEMGALTVNAGGDLARRSSIDHMVIGIENPLRPYDNEPPLCRVAVNNGALATSGQSRRGVRIGADWFGHCLDPRTGQPVDAVASISVLAPDCVTADVVATVMSVMRPEEAVALSQSLRDIGCLVIDSDGVSRSDALWREREVS